MTDKELLLIDLCAKLPYELIVNAKGEDFQLLSINDYRLLVNPIRLKEHIGFSVNVKYKAETFYIEDAKPYLRPISSMTEDEREILRNIEDFLEIFPEMCEVSGGYKTFDYLNSIHIDYRNLISLGLALPAPEGMYDIK